MEKIKNIFLQFAEKEAKHKSITYYNWSLQIMKDDELLAIIANIPNGQPKPNLFFAAVQYLSRLKGFEIINEKQQSYEWMRDFTLSNEKAIIHLLTTNRVQTNEVNRSSYLYFIFNELYIKAKKPLTLIEIGTSAGLLLNADRYNYEIEQASNVLKINHGSSVTIKAKNLGEAINHVDGLNIKNRYGIDLNCLDVNQEEHRAWLKALIWPEQKERFHQLQMAIEQLKGLNMQLLEGDFSTLIPEILHEKSVEGTQLVLFHTHVANQFSPQLKEQLLHLLTNASHSQVIYHVYNNLEDGFLHVDEVNAGKITSLKVLEKYDAHGKFFEWR